MRDQSPLSVLLLLAILWPVTLCQLSNRAIRVSLVAEKPFVYKDSSKTGNAQFSGFTIDMGNEVLRQLNLPNVTVTWAESADPASGSLLADGSWSGVAGTKCYESASLMAQLTKARYTLEKPILLSVFRINQDRLNAFAVAYPYLDVGIGILVRKPSVKKDPFRFLGALWLMIIAMTLVIAILTYAFDRISPFGFSKSPDELEQARLSLSASTTNAILTMMNSGFEIGRSWSTRVMLIGFFFFSLILIAAYTANFAAFLTVGRLQVPIGSLDDLRASRSPFGVVNGSANQAYFNNPGFESLRSQMKLFVNTQAALDALKAGEIQAFMAGTPIVEYIANHEPCDTLVVGEAFGKGNYAFPFATNDTALAKLMGVAVLGMRDDGTLEALYKRWWFDAGACSFSAASVDANRLGLKDLRGLFFLLLAFMGAAVMILLVEFLAKWYMDKHSNVRSSCLWHLCDDGDPEAAASTTTDPNDPVIRPPGSVIDPAEERKHANDPHHHHHDHHRRKGKAGMHQNMSKH